MEQYELFKVKNGLNDHLFVDGRKLRMLKVAKIPILIGVRSVNVMTEIVDTDVSLLPSKSLMKKCNIQLKFEKDTLKVFRNAVPLQTTGIGLCTLPVTKSKQFIDNVENGISNTHEKIILKVAAAKNDKGIEKNLHHHVVHPSAQKLSSLINNAGRKWANSKKVKKEFRKVTN